MHKQHLNLWSAGDKRMYVHIAKPWPSSSSFRHDKSSFVNSDEALLALGTGECEGTI